MPTENKDIGSWDMSLNERNIHRTLHMHIMIILLGGTVNLKMTEIILVLILNIDFDHIS